ncbi:MAG: multi-sensor signal transduction histidine kinase [Verrucomicrobiales bacterium]|nr:multi-sensor signal transduction histidine kinase [Verrucomicrobiales bacterium]
MMSSKPKESNSAQVGTAALLNFIKKLNGAATLRAVAELTRDTTAELFAWDALNFDIYVPELDVLSKVLMIDLVDGERREVAAPGSDVTPSPNFREVVSKGAKLVLRDDVTDAKLPLAPFGDKGRRSASLMFVPVRVGKRVLGLLSLQSYTPHAYTADDLDALQSLADISCGALMRLDVEKKYRSSFNNAVAGHFRMKPDGRMLTVNKAFEAQLGYTNFLAEVSELKELFSRTEDYCEFEKIIRKTGIVKDFETELLHGTVGVLWFSINGHTERSEYGAPLYFEAMIRNVSRRKSVEAELRRTEDLYRRAIRAAGAVSYGVDYKTRNYTFMDEGIQQLIGYTAQEMVPHMWKDIVKKRVMLADVAGMECEDAARRVCQGEVQRWGCDMLVTTRHGKIRWISDVSVQNIGADGKPTGSVGVLLDITERKEAELNALAFAKMHHGLSLATTAEAAAEIIADVAQDLFGWDACWVKLYNTETRMLHSTVSIDTIDGRQIRDRNSPFHPLSELHRRVLSEGGELILRATPTQVIAGAVPFGNKSRPSASIIVVPILYREGPVGIMSIQSYTPNAYDTRQVKAFQILADQCAGALQRIWADEAFRKSELQFRLVWDASVDGMRLTDGAGTVLMVNEAYCRLVAKSKSELEAHPLSAVYDEQSAKAALLRHRECFEARTTECRLEEHVILWNGTELWFETSNSLLELPNQPRLLLTILRNITERKKGALQVEALNRQLITASRKAGMAEVASGVLHNVGNVLNSVNVAAHLVSERLQNSRQQNVKKIAQLLEENASNLGHFFSTDERAMQLPSYVRKLSDYLAEEQAMTLKELETVRKNVDHIKDIVAMQQSYAKVSGLIQAQPIVELVDDALQMNTAALARHDVNLEKDFQANPVVHTDKHKVLQILVNFIRNAKYACDEGGKPDKKVKVTVKMKDPQWVQIIVSDNGIGVPAENLTRIFSHGFTTRDGGHGFGLHSSALSAKELEGSIYVHSDGPGTGAAFTLELPLNNPIEPQP